MKKYHSISSLVAMGRRIAPSVDVVTFDLFDTLVIRRIHDPDLVKLPVARFISSVAGEFGLRWTWQRVQLLRDSIEKRHRQETGKRFEDFEACYPLFMREMLGTIFSEHMSDALFERITDYEMAMENSMLVPRGLLVDWLVELHGQGKKIYVVSDIYLPASYLEKLVRHAGFADCVDEVVSSADSFLAKASGKAFPLLQERFSLDPERWLHVGDNPISDGLRPMEFGIRALVLHDGSEKRRKAMVRRLVNYADGRPFWRGRALQQVMAPLEQENRTRPDLYIEGYNFLAPLIGAFVQHIAERCRTLGVGKIFFLSREGWMFQQYWEKCMPLLYPDNRLPEIEYLYVSRMALAGVSCAHQGLISKNVDIVFLPAGNADFLDVCRIFALDAEPFHPLLHRYNIDVQTILSPHHLGFDPKNRIRFNEMLEDDDFQDEVRKQTAPANDALQLYLEDKGFFEHKDVALVDIGWLGTIQRFFYQAIEHLQDKPRVHGFLFGATRGIDFPTTPDNYIEGVLYDRHRFDLGGSTVLYARDLFEEACRAPHPTLNGYKKTGVGEYILDFRTTADAVGQAEQEQDRQYAPLQQGVLDAAGRYGASSALLGWSLTDYKPWLNYLLETKLAFPTLKEVDRIRHKHHLDDFHGNKQAKQSHLKLQRHLWNASLWTLCLSPFIRLRYFLRHIKDRLNEQVASR